MFAGDITAPRRRLAAWMDSIVVDHAFFRVFWHNFATVAEGRLYRANHPTPAWLAYAARRYGLRTVINLRGARACGSDALTRDAAARLGLRHIYAPFESRGAPHRDRILNLAAIFAEMREPALIHCKSGADRAGLAAGLFILIQGGTSAQALAQLSLRFLHFRHSSTGILDAFFAMYAREGEGRKPFLDWVREEYHEDRLRAEFRPSRIASLLNDRVLARE
ncbi:MAG: tyrosine-protein phosphatase [Acidibrevibacterium sp.]|uniref:tyrosine-protein phosphatase n=1 Tax=Acidibrevibacterium sp. TaxID=2606776 RepID=UPI003CFFC456